MVNIKEVRRNANLTLEKMAEMVGVSVSTLIRWEKGKTSPTLKHLPKIAEVLGITIEELLKDD